MAKETALKPSDVKILVVDDEADIRDLLSDSLTGAEFQVRTAGSGEAALESAARHHPDLIMLDIILPDIDGVSVYEKLRSAKATSNIPVIFFTALGEGVPPSFARRMKDAPYRLVAKPVSISVLLKEISSLLAASRANEKS